MTTQFRTDSPEITPITIEGHELFLEERDIWTSVYVPVAPGSKDLLHIGGNSDHGQAIRNAVDLLNRGEAFHREILNEVTGVKVEKLDAESLREYTGGEVGEGVEAFRIVDGTDDGRDLILYDGVQYWFADDPDTTYSTIRECAANR